MKSINKKSFKSIKEEAQAHLFHVIGFLPVIHQLKPTWNAGKCAISITSNEVNKKTLKQLVEHEFSIFFPFFQWLLGLMSNDNEYNN